MPPLPDPQMRPEFYRDVPFKRLLAWGVDTVLTLLISLIIIPFTAFTALFFLPFLILLVGFAYRTITLANSSATWGMRLFAIELRRADGSRLDLSTATAHTFGYTLSWAIPLLQVASIVLMATTEKGQGLTDHVLGTAMINKSAT